MDARTALRLGARRLLWLFLLACVLVWAVSESAFQLQKEGYDRPPTVVELVIPDGTAAQVAAGRAVPAIPAEMSFVTGDTLVVRNEDSADHQLGPLWIPARSRAALALNQAQDSDYTCSFQTSRVMGLDVRAPTTWRTRLVAVLLTAPPTATFFFVYSLAIWPLKPRRKTNGAASAGPAGGSPGA